LPPPPPLFLNRTWLDREGLTPIKSRFDFSRLSSSYPSPRGGLQLLLLLMGEDSRGGSVIALKFSFFSADSFLVQSPHFPRIQVFLSQSAVLPDLPLIPPSNMAFLLEKCQDVSLSEYVHFSDLCGLRFSNCSSFWSINPNHSPTDSL